MKNLLSKKMNFAASPFDLFFSISQKKSFVKLEKYHIQPSQG